MVMKLQDDQVSLDREDAKGGTDHCNDSECLHGGQNKSKKAGMDEHVAKPVDVELLKKSNS